MGDREEADAVLTTERLRLRSWREDDAEPFAAMNADPEVMRHLGGPMSRGRAGGTRDRPAAESCLVGSRTGNRGRFGGARLGLRTIVSVTAPENLASLGVMRRLGMTRCAARTVEVPGAPDLPVVVYSLSTG